MDVVSALRAVPRFKELHKKGRSRTQAEETEYQQLLATNPALNDIRLYEQYAQLVEMSGRDSLQEASLKDFELKYPAIVAQYNRRKLGKGRSRRRRLTRRRRTTRKRS